MTGTVIGRDAELASIGVFLDRVQRGAAVLAIEGESGIGKTTLWRAATGEAARRGLLVLACRSAGREAALSFAALADLLAPVGREILDRLPAPQRQALDAALLRAAPEEPAVDRRAVPAAVLSVLRELSRPRPVLVAVDDAHWLDAPTARALEFAARRLSAEPVGILVTVRLGSERLPASFAESADEFRAALLRVLGRPGPPARTFEHAVVEDRAGRLRLGPLAPGSLHRLIVERHGQGLPRPLLARVAHASLGNPLHTLEIAGALLRQGHLAAGVVLPVPEDLQTLVEARIRRLAPATREALLLAAALSRPVAGAVAPDRLAEAEQQRLVTIGEDGSVSFTHPAFAAAVYAAAPRQHRQAAHRELAARVTEVEERARHLALAAGGPDEAVAALLDRAAALARSRGAPEAAAELTERAQALTPPGDQAGAHRRTLAAAAHHFHAGDWGRARGLLELAVAGAEDDLARGDAMCLLGQVRYHQDNWPEAIARFQEALALGSLDARLTVTIRLQLAFASVAVGGFDEAAAHIDQALAGAERLGEEPLLAETLAGSAMIGFLRGQGVDAARLARSLELEDPDRQTMIYLRPTLVAGLLALYQSDLDGARAKLGGLGALVTERGEETDLPFVLTNLAWLECLGGDLAAAEHAVGAALELAAQAGSETMQAFARCLCSLVRAWQGEADTARAEAAEGLAGSERSGWKVRIPLALSALAMLDLSLGDPRGAAATLRPLLVEVEARGVGEPFVCFFLPDGIEALIALGELERAEHLTALLEVRGREYGRVWAVATGARCRGLLCSATGELDGALAALQRAMLAHTQLAMPGERARTLLALGRLRRRRREKQLAATALAEALAEFERIGAPLWAAQARAELARARPANPTAGELTATEHRIADLAAEGLTNREIAARLFISPRTVEANLAKVYRKLGVRSKAELARHMATLAARGA
jgi:DNA-binding CsgD family transcriptional regulator